MLLDNIIADIISNEKLNSLAPVFIRCKKLHILLVFITELYLKVPEMLE